MQSWLVLQLADSAFPTGGFAHSSGLEAAHQLGEVRGPAGARAFFEEALWQAGNGSLPFVRAAHEDPSRLAEIDALAHAFLTSHVANRASRTQGRAFAATSAKAFAVDGVRAVHELVSERGVHAHYAPVFGAILRALDVPLSDALRLHLHKTLRGVASAAVRLAIVGPLEAERTMAALAPLEEEVLSHCGALALSEATQSAPLIDLLGALHDRLYMRLFQS